MKSTYLLALVIVSTAGCKTVTTTFEDRPPAPNPSFLSFLSTKPNDVRVFCGAAFEPSGYFIGVHGGHSASELVALLQQANIRRVIIEKRFFPDKKSFKLFTNTLHAAGIDVDDLPLNEQGVASSNALTKIKDPRAVLIFDAAPMWHGFDVTVFAGKSDLELAELVNKNGVRNIVIESGRKTMPETFAKFKRTMNENYIKVDAYWTPSGTLIGDADVINLAR